MLQAGMDLDLAHESLGECGIFVQIREDHFHRLLALGEPAAHAENLSHASAAQHARYFVIADDVADLNAHEFECNAKRFGERRLV